MSAEIAFEIKVFSKIHGVEAKIIQDSKSTSTENSQDSSVDTLQKIVSTLAYVKFLVTFSLENVHVYVEGWYDHTCGVHLSS